MFESIEGTLKEKEPSRAVIEANGIGYRIAIPLSTYPRLPALSEKARLYLLQVVREDAHLLFGFIEKEERNLFETLLTISGIGPKTALALIGHMDGAAFQRAITTSDTRLLSKIPGIGKKIAERLVLEMKDKLKASSKTKLSSLNPHSEEGGLITDAIFALIHLGYAPVEAQKAVEKAVQKHQEENDLGRLISFSLQNI